ncbi:unnamed protein product [Thlaspi arvense]|uniref:F-box associated beta-propeller type 3 domain-containing protein n=1 Tax=Thlaspi arvense TaxID=13288 RepID=A0AAU9RM30_THLAR|nr:unnamed protein product [Thlaspi arvense]
MGGISTFPPVVIRGSVINYNGLLASAYPLKVKPLGSFQIWILELDKRRWLQTIFNALPILSDLSGEIQLNLLGMNKANDIILGPLKLPPKGTL